MSREIDIQLHRTAYSRYRAISQELHVKAFRTLWNPCFPIVFASCAKLTIDFEISRSWQLDEWRGPTRVCSRRDHHNAWGVHADSIL